MGMFTEWRDDENAELRHQLAKARAEIERKDKLIEQMREALTGVCEICPCDTAKEDKTCQDCDVGAALSAAEGGEA
jgi:hypothetical protein